MVRTAGAGTSPLRGLRTADTDPLAGEAMRTRGTIVVLDAAGDARASGQRWGAMRAAVAGSPRIVTPIRKAPTAPMPVQIG